ncbi:nucleotidyltransferase domain-containing protein [Galbibacter sp. EGI 63066]|uniref:nucleotidyltransferase family protein n=1 Tax=Galbibacter sp. EGI 63066 TaxID=2993559 RepID=UPI002249162C|nr:nucleotidyltransferase domain-containing protein [Galbibacter sp. EGI 63066]MCX2680851.1 nucleotidyltransferase domain-containing protein [Galbibacter sp. EGI 63066]
MIAINQYINEIRALCKTHNVEKLYLFGSATNDDFSPESDIDFLVKFKKIDLAKYFENYMVLKESLKNIFNREIDLVEEQTLKNPILIKSINKSKELIYG